MSKSRSVTRKFLNEHGVEMTIELMPVAGDDCLSRMSILTNHAIFDRYQTRLEMEQLRDALVELLGPKETSEIKTPDQMWCYDLSKAPPNRSLLTNNGTRLIWAKFDPSRGENGAWIDWGNKNPIEIRCFMPLEHIVEYLGKMWSRDPDLAAGVSSF